MTELLTVEQVARALNVSKGFVYSHAQELGGYALNDAPNAPLRFSAPAIDAWLWSRRRSIEVESRQSRMAKVG